MTGPTPKPPSTLSERELAALASRYEAYAEDRETVVSVFGAARRIGPWAPAEVTRAVAGFADVLLDFTRADLPAGVTEVNAYAVFGKVEIRVPASLRVELDGLALMGDLVHREGGGDTRRRLRRWLRVPEPTPPEAPRADAEAVLRIRGTAVFGDVVLQVV